ncbi:hypothetical protein FH608_028110 [Nonomuraea phyllanthi]|uniref:Cobalamin-independent methionine synthase MetE C-terminal/archaeal domain-containing protein n=1 Tax=Nonomuraea phyllanthi TaxID=2219224 RepID=A0A5C4W6M3_9ACTN|nr:hypothetical protein [Nonomuraea phyllanthi]KAB8191825.1 hypothetical protein FH608_028110 [Nonomuraea phyllanthi]
MSWAAGVFRPDTSGVADITQINTHVCRSWSQDVLAIGALDADVTSVEAARPRLGPLSHAPVDRQERPRKSRLP